MGLPFGLIFSIILIIIFIVVAFIAIKYFLNLGSLAKIGMFYEDLQNSVDEAWRSQSSKKNFKINLPSKIEKVCFANLTKKVTGSANDFRRIQYSSYDSNLFLIPPEEAKGLESTTIKHINLSKIIEKSNPYCVSSDATLKIKKDFYDRLVFIE